MPSQSLPITSDRPDMSGKTEVVPAKYLTTSDLQSGYFFDQFCFLVFFFVTQGKKGHWQPTVGWNLFWSVKSFKYRGVDLLSGKILNLLGKRASIDYIILELLFRVHNICQKYCRFYLITLTLSVRGPSLDVRFCHLKTFPVLKQFDIYNIHRPVT